MNTNTTTTLNGLDVERLRSAIQGVDETPAKGATRWQVATHWRGGTRMDTRVAGYWIGGEQVAKDFTIRVDEPLELCGSNRYANPQEHLFAALNSCVMVGFVAICALEGVRLDELWMETSGDIDLRGFFGLSETVKPGYEEITITLHVRGDASAARFREIHELALATSPNFHNLTAPIRIANRLQVGV